MNKNNLNILLIIALIFSHFVVYQIEFAETTLLKGIKFNIFPLGGFAGNESSNQTWSSVIVGYFIFWIFLVINFRKIDKNNTGLFYFVLIICTGLLLFECYIIYKINMGEYTGQYSRLGLVLYLLCLRINSVIHKTQIISPATSDMDHKAAS